MANKYTDFQNAMAMALAAGNGGLGGNPANNYSLEEQVVGTWIDGKPLYQKTFEWTVPTPIGDHKYDHFDINIGALNPKDVIRLDAFFVSPIGGWSRLPRISYDVNPLTDLDNNFYVLEAVVVNLGTENAYIRIVNDRVVLSGRPGYLTIQYTKTTD